LAATSTDVHPPSLIDAYSKATHTEEQARAMSEEKARLGAVPSDFKFQASDKYAAVQCSIAQSGFL